MTLPAPLGRAGHSTLAHCDTYPHDTMTTQDPRYELTTDDGTFLATAAAPDPTRAVELYCESRGHDVEATRDGLVVTTGEGAVQTVTARPLLRGDADVIFVT